jgi:integrase
VGYATGIRLGELKTVRWDQIDFDAGYITPENGETKNGEGRIVPVLDGDMHDLLAAAKKDRDANYPADSGEGERLFRREAERYSGLKPNTIGA